MNVNTTYRWTVGKIVNETPRVKNLYLIPKGTQPTFTAGQYVTVKMSGIGPTEGKAYSIASAPCEPGIRLSVKRIGEFSETLLSLRPGDEIMTSEPYGFFYPEPDDTTTLVFIAGGIGITPCLSIIKSLVAAQNERPVVLHYSNQTITDIAFYRELKTLAGLHSQLRITFYVTREKSSDSNIQYGRMSPEVIVASVNSLNDSEFFVCGSMDFTKSLWKSLHQAGVPQHKLYTEGFF